MASFIIHLAVASEINKKIKKDEGKILMGAIAPDISKLVGLSRKKTHFMKDGYPSLADFLVKYKNNLNDDFVFGYYIHLYTDYLWSKYFVPTIYDENKKIIKFLDGKSIVDKDNLILSYIYNDYTFANLYICNKYKLNLDILKNIGDIKNIIDEIPYDKFDIILSKLFEILKENPKKNYVFDYKNIDEFISNSVKFILNEINFEVIL